MQDSTPPLTPAREEEVEAIFSQFETDQLSIRATKRDSDRLHGVSNKRNAAFVRDRKIVLSKAKTKLLNLLVRERLDELGKFEEQRWGSAISTGHFDLTSYYIQRNRKLNKYLESLIKEEK